MAEQLQQLKAIGLRTYENQFSAPEGGMAVASDIVVDRPDIVETVRAYSAALGADPGATGIAALTQVNGLLVAAVTASLTSSGVNASGLNLYGWSVPGFGSIWKNFQSEYYQLGVGGQQFRGSINCLDNKLDCFEMNGNVYIAADDGIMKWEGAAYSSAFLRRYGAGMPKARIKVSTTGTTTFQCVAYGSVRYRGVYVRKDASKNYIFGEPSPSYTYFNNTAAAVNMTVQVLLPMRGIEPGDVIQFYRSETAVGASNAPAPPTDELQLVLEYVITQTDITTNATLIFNDLCPDAGKGAYLYTNTNTGEGILQSNTRPPLAKCATNFKNVAWYANTTTQQVLSFTIVNISDWSSFGQAGTIITLSNGTTSYTYTAGFVPANNNFLQFYAQAVVDALNASNLYVEAFMDYVSWSGSTGTNAGAATITLRTMGKGTDTGGTWTVTMTGANFTPSAQDTAPVLTAAGSNRTLLSDDGANRLYFSKPGIPEAVPLLNYVEIGSKGDPIYAIASLRDSLFVFKPRDGVFRVTGTTAQDIRVESFDPTVLITQVNGVGKAGNRLFVPSNKGIVIVSEAGVQEPAASYPIESDVLSLIANPLVGTSFVGRACEAERKYAFIANGTTMYQYNWDRDAWTTRSVPASGFIQALTAGPVSTTNSDRFWLGDNNHTSVQCIVPPAAAVSSVYTALASFSYVVIDGNNPNLKKRFTECNIVTTGSTVTALNVSFSTETTTTPEVVNVTGLVNPYTVRVVIPRSCQYAGQLTVNISQVTTGEYLKVSSVSLTADAVTTRTTR